MLEFSGCISVGGCVFLYICSPHEITEHIEYGILNSQFSILNTVYNSLFIVLCSLPLHFIIIIILFCCSRKKRTKEKSHINANGDSKKKYERIYTSIDAQFGDTTEDLKSVHVFALCVFDKHNIIFSLLYCMPIVVIKW